VNDTDAFNTAATVNSAHVAAASAANAWAAAKLGIADYAAPPHTNAHRCISQPLALSLLLALLSACVPLSNKPGAPAIPDEPINDQTAVGNCDNNIVADYPGGHKRGSSTIRCTKEISDISQLIATLKPGSTLLVLDIDDTLLTSDTFFGSDGWYEWLKKPGTPKDAQPLCKFDIIALNYEAGTQHAVEGKAGVDFVNGISLPKLLLTSRSAYYRGGTERELLAAAYQFPANFLSGSDGISWVDHDTTEKVVDAPVSYANGIEMITGHKKGKLLLDLFTRLKALGHKQKFNNIILVDDGAKNINSLHAYLPAKGYNYYGYWYRRVVKGPDLATDDVNKAVETLGDWQGLVRERYLTRWERWELGSSVGCGK